MSTLVSSSYLPGWSVVFYTLYFTRGMDSECG